METMPTPKPTFMQQAAQNKNQIIRAFHIGYYLILFFLILAAYLYSQEQYLIELYTIGVSSGKVAIVLFCLTILPGIARRFNIRNQLTSIIMLFRRQFGISVFSFAFTHYAIIMLYPIIFLGVPIPTMPPTFQLFGTWAFYLMAILFFTSNSWSVRKLGKWWGRIHSLIYMIAWLIFSHVFLQRISIWSVLMGIFATLETLSLIKFYLFKNQPATPSANA